MELFKLFGKIAIDNDEANSALDETSGKGEQAESRLSGAFKKIGAAVATYFAVDKIISFGKEVVNVAAEVSAETSAFEQIMGNYADEASKKVDKIADATGMVSTRLTPYMTSMTAKFKGLGYDINDATDFASRGLNLAADAAAFWDKSLDDSMGHLNSFINGSYEGGEAIGLFANDTQMASYAISKGIVSQAKDWSALDEKTKQATRLEYAENMFKMSGATGQAAKESNQYANVQANLTEKWRQFKAQIGEPILQNIVLPAMSKLSGLVDVAAVKFQDLKKWVSDNKETFDKLASAAKGVVDKIKEFVEWLSGGSAGATAFKAAIVGITAALTAYKAVTLAVTAAQKAQMIVTKAVAAAQKILNLVMSANPIGLVIAAVAALIAIFMYLWNNCEGFRNFWLNLWDKIKNAASKVADWFKKTWGKIVDWFKGIWESVSGFFSGLWDKIKNVVSGVINWFKKNWKSLLLFIVNPVAGIFSYLYNNFDGFRKFVDKIITSIKNIISKVIDWFKNNWKSLLLFIVNPVAGVFSYLYNNFEGFRNFVNNFVNSIKEFFKNLWDKIKEIWNGIVNAIKNAWDKIKENITKAANAVKTFVQKAFNVIKEKIINPILKARDKVKEIFEKIRTTIQEKITNAKNKVREIFDNIKNSIKEKIEWARDKVSSAVEKVKSLLSFEGLKKKVGDLFDDIKKKITTPIDKAKELVNKAIKKIKELFPLKLGKIFSGIKLPHFKISGGKAPWGIGGKGEKPSIGIDWYAKAMNNPMLLKTPTIFGLNSDGNLMGAGEAGDEVVSGAKTLMNMIRGTVQNEISGTEQRLETLISMLAKYMPELVMNSKKEIRLNSGVLVGELASDMDYKLGEINRLRERGH